MMTSQLLPDKLKDLWQAVESHRLTLADFEAQKQQGLGEYKRAWQEALLFDGHQDLKLSLISELGRFLHNEDLTEIERRCQRGAAAVKAEWEAKYKPEDSHAVEQFYNKSQAYIYDLMWWHTLRDDESPLAYVIALQLAQQHGCRCHLDFGAGIGAGSLLFIRHGFDSTLADISSTMLDFCRWRLQVRGISAELIDLKTQRLPAGRYDFVTAMDVFEHLVDPVGALDQLSTALQPGGFLFGRFHGAPDDKRPQHIVRDFNPVFLHLRELGFVEDWHDGWLWGHQLFRKPAG